MMNKKGESEGMQTSTIIALVLGFILLVLLALGIFASWGPFGSYFSPKDQSTIIDEIKIQCQSACSLKNKYSWCVQTRSFKNEEGKTVSLTCDDLSNPSGEYQDYGFEICLEITCEKQISNLEGPGEENGEGSGNQPSIENQPTSLSLERQKILTQTNNLIGKDASIYSNCFDAIIQVYKKSGVNPVCVYSDPPNNKYIFKNVHTNNEEESIFTTYQPQNTNWISSLWGSWTRQVFWVYKGCKTTPSGVTSKTSESKLNNIQPGDIISYIWSKSEGGHNAIFLNWVETPTIKKEDRIANLSDWNGKGSSGKKIFRYYTEDLSDNSNGVYVYWSPVEKT